MCVVVARLGVRRACLVNRWAGDEMPSRAPGILYQMPEEFRALVGWDCSQLSNESDVATYTEPQADADWELHGLGFFAHGMVSLHKGAVDVIGEGRVSDVRRAASVGDARVTAVESVRVCG